MIEIFAAIIISGSIASEVVKEKSYYGVPYAGKQCSCCSIGHRGDHKYHYYKYNSGYFVVNSKEF